VVATRSPVRPLIAIELDDSNHLTTKAKARDTLIESVFAAAGVPLLRIPYSAHGYQVSQIKRQIAELLQAKSTVPPAGRAQVSPAAA
jgi:hypothetical protein